MRDACTCAHTQALGSQVHAACMPMHMSPRPLPRCPWPDFVVVTDEAAGRTIPTAFLDRVKADFVPR